MTQPNETVIRLLYDALPALPHEQYGVINMLPFAHDSEQVREIRRHVSEAIVGVLDANGFLCQDKPPSTPPPIRVVTIKCGKAGCESEMLMQLPTSESGVALVDGKTFIAAMAGLNTQCPHSLLTLDDMRVHIEREFWASTCRECGAEVNDPAFTLKASGICDACEAKHQEG